MGKCGNLYIENLILYITEKFFGFFFFHGLLYIQDLDFYSLLPKEMEMISPSLTLADAFAGLSLISTLPLSQASLATVRRLDQFGIPFKYFVLIVQSTFNPHDHFRY